MRRSRAALLLVALAAACGDSGANPLPAPAPAPPGPADGNGAGVPPAPPPPPPPPPPASDKKPDATVPAVPALAGPSVLGDAGAVDRLDTPVALPKGMLDFLGGVDLLESNRTADAVPLFDRAIETDEENSNFHTARGAALVLAERMDEGLPSLRRAMKLDPANDLASRLSRLALLMKGDQLGASKFKGHGSSSNLDFLITEVGVGYGNRASAKAGGFAQTPQDSVKTRAAVAKLPTLARVVASAYRSGETASVQAVFALGVEQIRRGDFAAARRGFADVVAKFPYDWTSRTYHAQALAETGDPELARRELTYVLTWKRHLPEAFALRALCAARQGDERRARADLASLRGLDAKAADAAASAVEKALAASAAVTPGGDDVVAWAALGTPKAGATPDDLVPAALALRRSVDARRLRWDETYQDRLVTLWNAARGAPKNADRLADIAEFLRDHHDVRSLQVEPNGAQRAMRRQTTETKAWETDLAFALVSEALAADGRHARSWALKSALLLLTQDKLEEAEAAARAAIACDGKLVAGHMALSDCFHERAARLRAEAARLRQPQTATRQVDVVDRNGRHIRYDSETYSIPAPAADLARAGELDRLAAENDAREQQCLAVALAAAKGASEEPWYQALMLYLRDDFAGAKPWLEKSVAADPKDARRRHALANCLKRMGDEEAALEETSRAVDLQETTAEIWLAVAWTKLERNSWKAARTALDRAVAHDPSDARIWAYRGVLAANDGRAAGEAEAALTAAIAQEEARARRNGTTFGGGTSASPLSPQDAGLSMMLRLLLARRVFATEPARAASLYLATAGAERRMSEWGLAAPVVTAMLPFPEREAKAVAAPPTLVTVLKNNRIYCGQALVNAGRAAEAGPQFAAAEGFADRLPAGGTAYLDLELEGQYVPFRVSSMPEYVRLLNAQSLLAQGRKDEARMALQKVRYYLANRSQEQYAMTDDPIPALYEELAPQVGLR